MNFATLADVVDIVASFHRGYEPVDLPKFSTMLEECAVPSVGKTWQEIRSFVTTSGDTCGDLFESLYQECLVLRNSTHPKRIDDYLGETFIKTLITVGVLQDEAVDTWIKTTQDYWNATIPTEFNIDFDDLQFGYYGDQETLDADSQNIPVMFNDAISRKFTSLGPATWRDVLQQSPAEPTLSRGIPTMNDTMVAVAGWPDLTPAQVMTSMGCDNAILITRQGEQSQFGLFVAALLGASPQELDDLYLVDNNSSGAVTALRAADATYCINWTKHSYLDIAGVASEGYLGPLLTTDECILAMGIGALDQDVRGCTPCLISIVSS